jgi:hypothetical protein
MKIIIPSNQRNIEITYLNNFHTWTQKAWNINGPSVFNSWSPCSSWAQHLNLLKSDKKSKPLLVCIVVACCRPSVQRGNSGRAEGQQATGSSRVACQRSQARRRPALSPPAHSAKREVPGLRRNFKIREWFTREKMGEVQSQGKILMCRLKNWTFVHL